MLQERDKQTIWNTSKKSNEEIIILSQEKLKKKKEKLLCYLKEKWTENDLSPIDLALVKYLNEELKETIQKEVTRELV